MRKTIRIAFAFFLFFFVAIFLFLHSHMAKDLIRNRLTQTLTQSGFEIQIGQMEGTLASRLDLKEVRIQGKGVSLSIQELRLKPVLWRLLKKELVLNHLQAHGISVSEGSLFDFNGRFLMNRNKALLKGDLSDCRLVVRFDQNQKIIWFSARNPLADLKGKAFFGPHYEFLTADIQISSNELLSQLPFPASGRILGHAILVPEGEGINGRLNWRIPQLIVDGKKVGPVRGNGEATYIQQSLTGTLAIEPMAHGSFDLQLFPHPVKGKAAIQIENLQSLHLPHLYGQLQATVDWDQQNTFLHATATNFYYEHLFAQTATFDTDLKQYDLLVEKAKWEDLELETAYLKINTSDENWPYQISAQGTWTHPLEIELSGNKHQIEQLTGTFFNHPLYLLQPIPLNTEKTQLELAIGKALVTASFDRKEETTKGKLVLERFPLDFLSVNPLGVPVSGTIDLEAQMEEKNKRLQGDFKASIEQMLSLDASGQFSGQFDRNTLQIQGNLAVHDTPLIDLNGSIPIRLSLNPPQAQILFHQSMEGSLKLKGRVEEFLDFLNLGPHRLEGIGSCDLTIKNTLANPHLEGVVLFDQGLYENYYTGTRLQNIQAQINAEKTRLLLTRLTAQDGPGTGSLSAKGHMDLVLANHYPFQIDTLFNQLQFVEIDPLTAQAEGSIHIEGNSTSALAKGNVQITRTQFSIPEHIPHSIPELQVTYRNPIHPVPPPQTDYKPYPLFLDLHISAPDSISVQGRGLESQWKGEFQLGGTLTSPVAIGKLDLMQGEFHFSSRHFKLTEGSLSLSGSEHEIPYINLAAAVETKGIAITARLNGPLNNPQITLQSVPPLPLGSIMSYLLFGQDLSEISGFQAIEIASSLASMAGTGPDVMESTRRSLGVDRLRVVANPDGQGGESIALEVGKYVSDGVLVTFTQGSEESSTNISVEVELKNNFIFQIESDQRQEQGRFTLKWNLNY